MYKCSLNCHVAVVKSMLPGSRSLSAAQCDGAVMLWTKAFAASLAGGASTQGGAP